MDGIFREERNFLLFEDQLAESGRQRQKKWPSGANSGKRPSEANSSETICL